MSLKESHEECIADLSDEQLDRVFETMASFVRLLPKDGPIQSPVDEQLTAYALYKQASDLWSLIATCGTCATPKPSFFHPILRIMWNAWNNLGDLTKREAKRIYIENFIKRAERNYEKYHKELPVWMADEKYDEAKAFVKKHKDDFGVSCLHTPEGLKEIVVLGKELGIEF